VLRAQQDTTGATASAELPIPKPGLNLDIAVQGERVGLAWGDSFGARSAIWVPSTGELKTGAEFSSSGFDTILSAPAIAIVSLGDAGFGLYWAGNEARPSSARQALYFAPVEGGAPVLVRATDWSHSSGIPKGLDAVSLRTGVAVVWGAQLLLVDAGGAVLSDRELPTFQSGVARIAWNPRTQTLATLHTSWTGRRPMLELFLAEADGGVRRAWERQDTSYFTERANNGVALTSCGDGFLSLWRDDATHDRGTPVCKDAEYCLSNDLRAAYVTAPDANAPEWILNRVPGEPTRRIVDPTLAPTPNGALDIAWREQDFIDGRRHEERRVLHRELIRCDCLTER
jgi:hypothetical protein